MNRLVLASASPARLSVLRAAGIEPLVRVSGVDEDAIASGMPSGSLPQDVVTALARAKAEAVAAAETFEDAVIVGCDSMLLIGNELQGKPHTVDFARHRWAAMAGNKGELLTGHAVIRVRGGQSTAAVAECSSTTVHFSVPSASDLEAYLSTGEPLSVAGAFTLDGLGGWFVDRIEGDPSSVIGIGLPLLRTLLHRVGISVADLWSGDR